MRPGVLHETAVEKVAAAYPQLRYGGVQNKNMRRRTQLSKAFAEMGEDVSPSELPRCGPIPDLWGIDRDDIGRVRLLFGEVENTSPVTFTKLRIYADYAMRLNDLGNVVLELWVFDTFARLTRRYTDEDFDYVSLFGSDEQRTRAHLAQTEVTA